ncbi:anti-sigma factor family protein [Dyella acidisoli]|uniref:Membrane protein n=1 Tax=Dyella acidisoli TaxID=1867834 RepID=A0ABQ5XW37_9GAMM|nr:anti-sigma factor [Dyella acidisoli]GLQ94588.1 membrane protein [Dyella acidisoli]
MMCDDARLLLHAYLDNELDATQSVAIDRHMQACQACAALHADYTLLHQSFERASLYRRAPDALRKQWSTESSVPSVAKWRRPPVALAMAAGFVTALLIAAPAWWYTLHRSASQAVDEVVSSHIRSMQAQHLMDVASTDQHTVKPWFAGKLDFSPRVKDLTSEGFPLVGGRLDALDGHSVAALVYRRHLHVINLYQWPISAPTAETKVTQLHGYTMIQWTDERMHFIAISDINEGELQQFVQAFRNDAAPL